MTRDLKLSIGQWSDKGRKPANQDFHGALIPDQPLLGLKGVAIALADGISSSKVSRIAAESAVKTFLTDYYCTSETWSVKTSAQRVIAAANSWLHTETRRSQHGRDMDQGYVCTFDVLVLKAHMAHVFHIGDARLYRLSGRGMEQLTTDHRVRVSSEQAWLGRALGMNPDIEIDYQDVPIRPGEVFVLATDGVYEHVTPEFVAGAIAAAADDLDAAARHVGEAAFAAGSPDNLTVQIVRVDDVPDAAADAWPNGSPDLPPPPLPRPGTRFEGYQILRELHASARAHIYLAADGESGERVAIKIPAIGLRDDAELMRRFAMEEWAARRIDSPHVLKPRPPARRRDYLFTVSEFVEGQTLTQWMIDNPAPDLETVRSIVEQIARGLRAFHRREMLHQDLRPDNIMIDRAGTVKIIDFGAVSIAGVAEARSDFAANAILGTVQYTAPEYFSGEAGTWRSDLFSLGVIAYQMLTGRLPYGAAMARARTPAARRKVPYVPARTPERPMPNGRVPNGPVPDWIDGALHRALHPDPARRHEALSEFLHELRHPNPAYVRRDRIPLAARDPATFWRIVACILACAVVWLAVHPLRP